MKVRLEMLLILMDRSSGVLTKLTALAIFLELLIYITVLPIPIYSALDQNYLQVIMELEFFNLFF